MPSSGLQQTNEPIHDNVTQGYKESGLVADDSLFVRKITPSDPVSKIDFINHKEEDWYSRSRV